MAVESLLIEGTAIPSLPTMGVIGLCIVVGVCILAGAFIIMRK